MEFELKKLDREGFSQFGRCLEIAKERGYSRVELLAFGEGPRKFYESFGLKCEEQNRHYRLNFKNE